MPAEAKDTEQPTRDGRWLRNPSQLDVVELGVRNVLACAPSAGEKESKRKIWRVVSPSRDRETPDRWSAVGWNCGRSESGPRTSSVDAVLNCHAVKTTG